VGKRETAIERLCMETASMAVFAPGIAVLLSLQQLDIRKVNPQIRAYVNHLHIPQLTYFRPNRLRNKQKDLLFQYSILCIRISDGICQFCNQIQFFIYTQ
jgi:hypothetical protein